MLQWGEMVGLGTQDGRRLLMGIIGDRAGVRAGRYVSHIALLNKLWPHLGPRMGTILQYRPAQHPHLPTLGHTRPKVIMLQKGTRESNCLCPILVCLLPGQVTLSKSLAVSEPQLPLL